MGRTTSRGGTSSETYTKCLSESIPELNDMTSSQVLDVKGDADIGGDLYTGGSNGISITTGSGAPSASAKKGSIYINVDATTTTTRIYINTDGSTTWAYLTTSA